MLSPEQKEQRARSPGLEGLTSGGQKLGPQQPVKREQRLPLTETEFGQRTRRGDILVSTSAYSMGLRWRTRGGDILVSTSAYSVVSHGPLQWKT